MKDYGTCELCYFFKKSESKEVGDNRGECYRNPPSTTTFPAQDRFGTVGFQNVSAYAQVKSTNRACGEYRPNLTD